MSGQISLQQLGIRTRAADEARLSGVRPQQQKPQNPLSGLSFKDMLAQATSVQPPQAANAASSVNTANAVLGVNAVNAVKGINAVNSVKALHGIAEADGIPREGTAAGALQFSKHAQKRLASRNIELSPMDLEKIEEAVDTLRRKGGRDSLVLMGDLALVVSVKNNTVITAVDENSSKENVFTNIDSAVIAR
jgi:flagellar operon protein